MSRKHHSPRFLTLVEGEKKRINEITAGQLGKKVETEGVFHLVDVREAEEYARRPNP